MNNQLDVTCYILFHLLCAQPVKRTPPNISRSKKLQHTTNWEQDDWYGNSSIQSQAPEDGYINVRNMLSA